MYYPYFITYMAAGFVISLAVFFWALKHGQFKDQQRARFLPLGDEEVSPAPEVKSFNRYEGIALLALALVGLALTGAVLINAIIKG